MNNKNYTIAVLIDWISSPYHIELIAGLEEAGRNRNVNIITFVGGSLNSPKKYESRSNYLYDFILHDCIDGIIIESGLLGLYSSKNDIVHFLSKFTPVPVVSISAILDTIPSIVIDNGKGLEKIILHLINEHHCKTFAFISGPDGNTDSQERFQVYKKTLMNNNIDINPDLVFPGSFVHTSGKKAVQILIDERHITPDAIVCANDDMAMGAIEELASRNIRVPEEIAVVGFDDQLDSRYHDPPLTTVRRPLFKIGEKAIDILLKHLQNKKVPEIITLDTEPVIRMSCGCPDKDIPQHQSLSCSLLPQNTQYIIQLLSIYRSLGYLRDINRMKDFFLSAFPGMGIERCFYSVFKGNNVAVTELLLSYSHNRECTITDKGDLYSLKTFIKERVLIKDRVFTFRLISLVYDSHILGLLGYENQKESTIFDSTLRTSFLVNIMTGLTLHHML
ncbi:MAG: LacI family DNA-binding transcriptional regulator [Spirochaetales bacterium]|nr:LacI family DNA-binding transcriptional regulator [Spirochaetales bacterium]